MAGLITGTLASHLEANRETLNQRVLELQRSSTGFDADDFAAAIAELVPPILAAVEAGGDGFGSIVAQSLVDAALELSASGLLQGPIRDAWSSLLIKRDGGLKRAPVLAIQFLEGEAAQRKVIELRRWLVEHGATSQDVT